MSENSPLETSGSLTQDHEGENDYTLKEGEMSCWITVGEFSVYIVRGDPGVIIEVFDKGDEADAPLTDCSFP